MEPREFSYPGRSPVITSQCSVATSHPLATTSALTVLREGGNAVDAALAASATLCVVEPHMTGIGGDCFAIVGEADGKLHGINGSGRSAVKTELAWYLDRGFVGKLPETSPHAVTVPGALRAWEAMHQKFGSMDFARLFADAVRYAENGFPVGERVASDWGKLVPKLSGNEVASKILLKSGRAPNMGENFAFPELAETLRTIALNGVDDFYSGEIAEDIASTVQGLGGFLSVDDLASTSADWVELISTDYHGHTLHEIPPNGQGLAALAIVKLLEELGAPSDPNSLERAHLELECGRIGYAFRDAYISDPEYLTHSVSELLSRPHISELAKNYSSESRNNDIALPEPMGSDTVYLSVVDRDGMAVSFINSIFGGFGTGIVTPKTGIVLQNRGSGFRLIEGHPNALGPSKRPFHTIIPAMVTKNGKVTHSFGVMGGSYQAMGHAHVLSNMLDYSMNPQAALDHPRLFWNDEGDILSEASVPGDIVKGLSTLGHTVRRSPGIGGGQIIQLDHSNGCLIAGSDPRKDGHAAGI